MIEESDWVGDKTCMRMQGHSMTELGIAPGHFVILQRGVPFEDGSLIAYSLERDPERVRIGKLEISPSGSLNAYSQRVGYQRRYEIDIPRERILAVVLGIVRNY